MENQKMTEQDEINLRNLLVRYVRCMKIVFSLRDASTALRDDAPIEVYRRIESQGQVAFDESGRLATMIARNPLIIATAPETLHEIKEERFRAPEERRCFNPFLELLDARGRFNRQWYRRDDRDVVDFLMTRLYDVLGRKNARQKNK